MARYPAVKGDRYVKGYSTWRQRETGARTGRVFLGSSIHDRKAELLCALRSTIGTIRVVYKQTKRRHTCAVHRLWRYFGSFDDDERVA